MRTIILFLAAILALEANAQHRYIVWFPDKENEQTEIAVEVVPISQKARERRAQRGIGFSSYDFPVSEAYLFKLREKGHRVLQTSRWLNAALVASDHPADEMKAILPSGWRVQKIVESGSGLNKFPETRGTASGPGAMMKATSAFNYGLASDQNYLLGIDYLHDQGYTGKNVTIAFFDAGYAGFNVSPALDSTRASGRMLGSKDFWNNSPNVFWGHDHGLSVLTEVVGNMPGVFVGMAPHANLLLALTDHPLTETHQDEFNYVVALEWADSIGADLVSASISYLGFDPGEGDYTFSDMDGETSIVAQGVKIAARNGMLIVNGAGNTLGAICTPCDVDSILCVGGTYQDKSFDGSSSGGPTADGRIKPDVAAVTKPVNTVDSNGVVVIHQYGGTSSATPQVSGLAACLIQKYPSATNMQLIHAIKMSAHKASNPDNFVGWGVPNARVADSILGVITGVGPVVAEKLELSVSPNPAVDKIVVRGSEKIAMIQVMTLAGVVVEAQQVDEEDSVVLDLSGLASGVYQVKATGVKGGVSSSKLVKL